MPQTYDAKAEIDRLWAQKSHHYYVCHADQRYWLGDGGEEYSTYACARAVVDYLNGNDPRTGGGSYPFFVGFSNETDGHNAVV